MPAERVAMRQVREIIRLKFSAGISETHRSVDAISRVHCGGGLEIARRNRFESICDAVDQCVAPSQEVAIAVEESFELIRLVWPAAWREVNYFVRALIPLETDRDNYWRSGSDADCGFRRSRPGIMG
jgi:hypothetical protein